MENEDKDGTHRRPPLSVQVIVPFSPPDPLRSDDLCRSAGRVNKLAGGSTYMLKQVQHDGVAAPTSARKPALAVSRR